MLYIRRLKLLIVLIGKLDIPDKAACQAEIRKLIATPDYWQQVKIHDVFSDIFTAFSWNKVKPGFTIWEKIHVKLRSAYGGKYIDRYLDVY